MAINTTVENINNQPTIQPRTVTGIFTKYIAKTLPLAFDESMSYYECICALLEYLNETIVPDINNTNAGLSELQTFYLDLQNYVNTYFDSLDVQEEINNKLDSMVENGTLTQLIRTYIDPYLETFNNTIEEQNATIQNLNNKITNATNGNPLVANSTSDMTNTSKIYVLTTDGKWYYYNGTSWIAGGDYQSTVNSDSVNMLEYEMELYTKGIVPLYNRMNNASYNTGHYYNNTGGNIEVKSNSDYGTIDRFPVKANTTYTCYDSHGEEIGNLSRVFSFVADENGHIIETFASQPNIHKLVPTHDGYLYVTFYERSSDTFDSFMICVDGTQPTSFQPYNTPYNYIILNESFNDLVEYYEAASQQEIVQRHTINVGPNEYYTSIKSAVNSINNSSALNIYDIIIKDGTYNEYDITLPNYVNLIGESGIRENCIINGELTPDSTDETIASTSTINMNYNNELHNLTIIGKNVRYPVHDETNGSFKNWKQVVDNCYIEHLGNQEVIQYRIDNNLPAGDPWTTYHAWGMGASSGANLLIKNSKFVTSEYPFYTHGASNFEKPYLITIEDSELISKDLLASIYIDNSTPTIDGNTIIVKNSLLNSRYQVITYRDVKCIISGSVVPVYQRINTILSKLAFPIFTENTKYLKASQDITKGTFVTSIDGVNISKANNNTPLKDIIGYVIGDVSNGDIGMVVSKYMQPTSQTWPETSITSGQSLCLDSNGKIKISTSVNDIVIGVTQDRWYKLYM